MHEILHKKTPESFEREMTWLDSEFSDISRLYSYINQDYIKSAYFCYQ